MLFVNADDLGRTQEITDRILTCYSLKRINSGSAMTFMKDSKRAAELAMKNGLPTGLHLNFTQRLTDESAGSVLKDHHRKVAGFLNALKINQILFNPFLHKSFDYVFQAQWEEFCRLYGKEPTRVDGHHHMHLCANMLTPGRLPKGLRVRRNFTFASGEKAPLNRLYRRLVDNWLNSRYRCMDGFFSMAPIDQKRLQRIISLARTMDLELMVHPGVEVEFKYLMCNDWLCLITQ